VYAAPGRNYPPGDLRVSDADRDRALTELSEHFQAGRLTAEEFEERSGLALQAKTGNDVRALLADLPVSQAAGTGMTPAPGGPAMPRHRGAPIAAIVAVACGFLAVTALAGLLSAGGSQHHGWGAVIVPIVLLLVLLRRLGRGAGGRRL
jgi:Domain of unknown function (DUF1707)